MLLPAICSLPLPAGGMQPAPLDAPLRAVKYNEALHIRQLEADHKLVGVLCSTVLYVIC